MPVFWCHDVRLDQNGFTTYFEHINRYSLLSRDLLIYYPEIRYSISALLQREEIQVNEKLFFHDY